MNIVNLDKLSELFWDGNYMEIHKDDIPSIPSAFDGMTNGEVMKAILPDIKVTINKFLGNVVINGAFGKFVTTLEWWLDSYKGGVSK